MTEFAGVLAAGGFWGSQKSQIWDTTTPETIFAVGRRGRRCDNERLWVTGVDEAKCCEVWV